MTIKCSNCNEIPGNYSGYKGQNYCMPCLYKIAQGQLRGWIKDFPFFNILEEYKEIKKQDIKQKITR